MPAQRKEFWEAKFDRTIARDRKQTTALTALGLRVAVLWECDVRKPAALRAKLAQLFLDSSSERVSDEL